MNTIKDLLKKSATVMGSTASVSTSKIDSDYGRSAATPSSSYHDNRSSERSLSLPLDHIHVAMDANSSKSNCSEIKQHFSVRMSSSERSLLTSSEIDQLFLEKYTFGRKLGEGASAAVYLVYEKSSGKEYACKILHKDNKMNDVKTMMTEMAIFLRLMTSYDEDSDAVHHVTQLYELFEGRETIYLVMEKVDGGELIYGLASLQEYQEATVAKLFQQVLLGVQELHQAGIVHRDLKLDNLLYDTVNAEEEGPEAGPLSIKISDFGLSTILNCSANNSSPQQTKSPSAQDKGYKGLQDMWGTPEYFAPEVYQRAYGAQADLWSLGCILYEILTGSLAFPQRDQKVALVDRILLYHGGKPQRLFEMNSVYQSLSHDAQSLIKGLLKRNPKKRLSLEEALNHPWITQNINGQATASRPLFAAHDVLRERVERRKLRQIEQARREAIKQERDREIQERHRQRMAMLSPAGAVPAM